MKRIIMGMLGALMAISVVAGAAQPAAKPSPPATQPITRTRAQVEALIADAGKTPPDWWNSVPLNYPKTLDLTWANSPGWNNQKNVGQYMWDIIDPNPGRWKDGVKLLHHVLTVNKDNPKTLHTAMGSLAHAYTHLLEDYPRGAFWARKHGDSDMILANCYWKLGSKEMAVEVLKTFDGDPTRNCSIVKLWAEMGELDTALRLADEEAANGWVDAAYLAAGDACRLAGRYPQAIAYYQKILAAKGGTRDIQMNQKRARASLDAVKLFDALDLSRIADGAFRSSSIGYTGPIEVEVTVKAHRIDAVKVTRHTEKQFYSSITDTTGQIIRKQSVKGIDATSGATITSEAIINATAKALAGAK